MKLFDFSQILHIAVGSASELYPVSLGLKQRASTATEKNTTANLCMNLSFQLQIVFDVGHF